MTEPEHLATPSAPRGWLATATQSVARAAYRRFLFPAPSWDPVTVPANARARILRARDGAIVHALELGDLSAARHVVHFHGNGETIGDVVSLAEALVARGVGVSLAEYRGYGRSRASGVPSEEGFYADACAVLDDLEARGVDRSRVVLWGMSLGSGVAAEMSARGRGGAGLVLVAAFTSVVAVGEHFVPWFPVRAFMTDRFETIAKTSRLRVPTLIVHGTDDPIVPHWMGEHLARVIDGATFLSIDRGHHTDAFVGNAGASRLDAVVRFIGG